MFGDVSHSQLGRTVFDAVPYYPDELLDHLRARHHREHRAAAPCVVLDDAQPCLIVNDDQKNTGCLGEYRDQVILVQVQVVLG
ncbi:hypothetical protein [Lentzea tibetensis]|uniref:hypothetical protein n=1 Tax=Lentzea tibetensis TaxID=2591470 RepID=UPI001646051D|nr:hypothetical protein [Lentzea tibetensis]